VSGGDIKPAVSAPGNALLLSVRGLLLLSLGCAALFLMVSGLYIILDHHVAPLSRDQWYMYHGYLTTDWWQAAIKLQNHHRLIIPYFICMIDIEWFGASNLGLISFFLLCIAACLVLLLRTLWRQPLPLFEKSVMTFVVLGITFWLGNFAQQGWGLNGTVVYLIWLCLLGSVYSLDKVSQNPVYWLPVWLFALLASFTFGVGILIWPVLIAISVWILRQWHLLLGIVPGFILALALYMALPDGSEVSKALAFDPMTVATFVAEYLGAPVYYALSSWGITDKAQLQTLAFFSGIVVGSLALWILVFQFSRCRENRFLLLCSSQVILGLGVALLIPIGRSSLNILDPFADRYLIWPTLLWLGLLPLLLATGGHYTRLGGVAIQRWGTVFCALPLAVVLIMLLPSQLDYGSRLAGYDNKVRNGLLSYSLGVAEQRDARRVLDWAIDVKMPYFLDTLGFIRLREANVFSNHRYKLLGRPFPAPEADLLSVAECSDSVLQAKAITPDQLVDLEALAPLHEADYSDASDGLEGPVAWRVQGRVGGINAEQFLIFTDKSGMVIGLGHPVNHNRFPNSKGKWWTHPEGVYGLWKGASRPAEVHAYVVASLNQPPLCRVAVAGP